MASREESHWRHVEQSQTTRAIRKQTKRNREPDKVRRKGWVIDDDPESYTDLEAPTYERVMPRGEQERRRVNLSAISTLSPVEEYEETSTADDKSYHGDEDVRQGLVTEVSSGLCRVKLDGRSLLCSLRGSLSAADTGFTNLVAVGDLVMVTEKTGGQGVVERVLPRRSALARPDVFRRHLQQVIAANVDQLLIVASWREPAFWPELVDRYLITAARNRLQPIVCINKVDLAGDADECQRVLRSYVKLRYCVIFASALTLQGIDELRATLRGRSTVLAGLSGVGKSSLLSAVQPGFDLRTHDVSARHHAGQHTTTQANLIALEMGGVVVDTPGIREFGLSGLRQRDLAAYYPEIALGAEQCRFDDCLHADETGCAIRALVGAGWISSMRHDNYRKIMASLPV